MAFWLHIIETLTSHILNNKATHYLPQEEVWVGEETFKMVYSTVHFVIMEDSDSVDLSALPSAA